MKETKPFTCHICHRKTDELYFCQQCKATVCFKCLWDAEKTYEYSANEYLCENCVDKKEKLRHINSVKEAK